MAYIYVNLPALRDDPFSQTRYFADTDIPRRVFWGDTHLHTSNSVDASTRGLANLCLAIFNSNEFMFVD